MKPTSHTSETAEAKIRISLKPFVTIALMIMLSAKEALDL